MRRISAVLLLCATFLPLSGCTLSVYNNYRELERLQVIETVGLDAGEDGGVVLSVSSGRDASGREPLRASAEAPSVTEAMQRLQGLSRSDELFFSGTGCILIGEAAAAQTARWLELVARSDSLRLDTPLFIVRGGEAAELVTQAGGEDGDITQIMRALISFAEKSGPARIYTCADAARSLTENGAALAGTEGMLRVPCVPMERVADPTAAGDSFVGAFCTGLCAGLEREAALALASHTAALTVSRMGAQPSLPTLGEVQTLLRERGCRSVDPAALDPLAE